MAAPYRRANQTPSQGRSLDACQSLKSCLYALEEFTSKNPTTKTGPSCNGCVIGAARKTCLHTPDDTFGPAAPSAGTTPAGQTGRVKTRSGLCLECAHQGNTNAGNTHKRKGVKATGDISRRGVIGGVENLGETVHDKWFEGRSGRKRRSFAACS